jgi:hypothetical protein
VQRKGLSAIGWWIAVMCVVPAVAAATKEPQPTPENTISIQLSEPVRPPAFSRPVKFFVADVVDRSGNAQPMLVYRPQGGIFLDKAPTEVTRIGLENCLRSANMLAADRDSADLLLTVYVFHFGLATGSGFDFFGKVEFAVMLKDPKSGKSEQITALGTSIANGAMRKKNVQKNIQEDIERAFEGALQNLLRGVKLRDAVNALNTSPQPSGVPTAPSAPATAAGADKPAEQK